MALVTQYHRVEEKFRAGWPPEIWQAERVCVAVSGGIDSVALLRCMAATSADPRRLTVAHFDHQLQPYSQRVVEFVRELAAQLNLSFELGTAPVREVAAASGDGIEAAARTARYAWLQATAERLGTRYVVTAHTADDQAETVLHRILRGTGIGGLSGIPRVRDLGPVSLIRPLLEFHREELREYLHSLGQSWREDPSNLSREFTRNRLRHDLLPLLAREYNPEVSAALLRLAKTAEGTRAVIAAEVARLWPTTVVLNQGGKSATLKLAACRAMVEYLLIELLIGVWRVCNWPRQAMTQEHWEGLARWITRRDDSPVDSTTGAYPQGNASWHLPGGIRAHKRSGEVELRRQ